MTRYIQTGQLPHYVGATVLLTIALVGISLVSNGASLPALPESFEGLQLFDLIVGLLVALGGWYAALGMRRLEVLLGMGLVGIGIALLFLRFSAPDLALTQMLVETLLLVVLALMLHRLPKILPPGRRIRRLLPMTISVFTGLVLFAMIWTSTSSPAPGDVSGVLTGWSLSEAYGANVVNVILVDFRAFDTFGEIAVLVVAALGVSTLLWRRTVKERKEDS